MIGVLYVPQFRLQAITRCEPERREGPLALLTEGPTKTGAGNQAKWLIREMTPAARKAGVEFGMTATQGKARCPALEIVTPIPSLEQGARDALLQFSQSLSPHIEDTAEGLCTIDLKGTAYSRQGADAIHDAWIRPLQSVNLSARAGMAGNPDLARMAAQFANPVRVIRQNRRDVRAFLDPLPIRTLEALEASAEVRDLLSRWGLRTLGDLIRLPKEAVIERLGEELIPVWERASGGRSRPLKRYQCEPIIAEGIEFETGIERLEALIFTLNRFLEQIAARLASIYLVAETLTLELGFEDGNRHTHEFRIPEPTRDPRVLLHMLHTYLETFRAAAPVVSARLTARPARSVQQQLSLFESHLKDPNRFAETLARLEGLLGENRVGSPAPRASHRPDDFGMAPFQPEQAARATQSNNGRPARQRSSTRRRNGKVGAPRGNGLETQSVSNEEPPVVGPALRQFRPPKIVQVTMDQDAQGRPRLQVTATTSDQKDAKGKGKSKRRPCRRWQGPWHRSGDWWDQQPWARDEWDVELADGGIYRLARQHDQWQLDGVYD